jgi:UDP-N-acetyl-D-glucosamine dehydrogenase
MKKELLEKIENRTYKVGIVGLGYVGLPLAITFVNKGFPVVGFDIDPEKVTRLNKGETYIRHIGANKVKAMKDSGIAEFTTDFTRIPEVDAIIMCVPTPLDDHREPDMTYVVDTTKSVAPYMRKGQLIVL